VGNQTLERHLQAIAAQEQLELEAEALRTLAAAAEGSVRDALGLLDQIAALAQDKITASQVVGLLGLTEEEELSEFVEAAARGQVARGLEIIARFFQRGKDTRLLLRDLSQYLRDAIVVTLGGKGERYFLSSRPTGALAKLSLPALLEMVQIASGGEERERHPLFTGPLRLFVELVFLKMCQVGAQVAGHRSAGEAGQRTSERRVREVGETLAQTEEKSPSTLEVTEAAPALPTDESAPSAAGLWAQVLNRLEAEKRIPLSQLLQGTSVTLKDDLLTVFFDYAFNRDQFESILQSPTQGPEFRSLLEQIFGQALQVRTAPKVSEGLGASTSGEAEEPSESEVLRQVRMVFPQSRLIQ